MNEHKRCLHRTHGRDGFAYQCVKLAGHWWPWHVGQMGNRWLSRRSYNWKKVQR